MLWRKEFETVILREFEPKEAVAGVSLLGQELIVDQFQIVLVSASQQGFVRQEIWRRLIVDEFGPEFPMAHIVNNLGLVGSLSDVVPPSRRSSVFIANLDGWPLIKDVAAWCPIGKLLMIGQPTESAWDEFCSSIRKSLSA